MNRLQAGSGVADITPANSQFLYGYPHMKRYSTGVHDPLLASALYLSDGTCDALLIANDIILVSKASAQRCRQRIAEGAVVPAERIIITATHTHSGPVTADMISNEGDPTVPNADPAYVRRMEDGIVAAGLAAVSSRRPARIGTAIADGGGLGTNRHDPAGPADRQIPVLLAQTEDGKSNIAAMLVHAMHPTVLHEDSTLVSGDFPGLARRHLQSTLLGVDCPVLRHMGAAGNQSPRHVTQANTFAEAERLGEILSDSVAKAIASMRFSNSCVIDCRRAFVELPVRTLPMPRQATDDLADAKSRLEALRRRQAPRADIRTAECDWFGAEETLVLSRAAATGALQAAARRCMPAEVQVLSVGPWRFAAWPGEVFVEFALELRRRHPETFLITLANGELQGYLVTEQAVNQRYYEATNAIFRSPDAALALLRATNDLIERRP